MYCPAAPWGETGVIAGLVGIVNTTVKPKPSGRVMFAVQPHREVRPESWWG